MKPSIAVQGAAGPIRQALNRGGVKAAAADAMPWSGLSSQSKRLLRMCGALMLLMIIAIVGTLLFMRQTATREAGASVTKLGTTLSEQATRSLQSIDRVLAALSVSPHKGGASTVAEFRAALGTEHMYHDLRTQLEGMPQVRAFGIVDASGDLVNASGTWPAPALNVADRAYFDYVRDHDDTAMFVSAPVVSQTDGTLGIDLVRRVNGPDGRFLGLVYGILNVDRFSSFYESIAAGGTSVALVRSDGTVLIRYPALGPGIVKVPDGMPWYQHALQSSALYVSPGFPGTTPELMSLHKLADYPIVVSVGTPMATILATWHDEALLIGGCALCAIICVGLLLRALTLQLRRLEQSEAFLVTQNDTLHRAQERMRVQSAALLVNQRELAEKSSALEMTLETMDQGLLTISREGQVSIYNRRVLEMLNLPADWLATKPDFADIIAYQRAVGEFDVPGQHVPPYVSSGQVPQQAQRYERLRPNGRAIEVQSIPLTGGGMVRTFTDITDRRRSEEQIRYFARHDSLTRLVNRVVFNERLEQAIELADRTGRSIAVLCLDLDRFKVVNDTRGHAVGDKLLAEVSARLQSSVRETDTVARMGGDEFAVVQPLVDQPEQALQLAARLLELISQPYMIDGSPAVIGLSVGIALYPQHGATAGALLRSADMALYQAKSDGRGLAQIFEESMEAAQRDVFQLEQDLGQALSRGELELAYQPIVDAGTRTTAAYEVLLRWNHPTRGLIQPADFIGLAEMSGAILPIGNWVLETACTEAATWPGGVRVSVNLSPLQFRKGDLVEQVRGVLARTGLAPDRLSLEVTESLLLDGTRQVISTMEDLRAQGVRFSLDDFGTAHAGLSYLRCFPFDAIKIDKSFVQEAVNRPESRAIVKTILAMASVLKLNVIAEGVETEDQLKLLRQMRCRQVQGYLTGKPLSAARARTQIELREQSAAWAKAAAEV